MKKMSIALVMGLSILSLTACDFKGLTISQGQQQTQTKATDPVIQVFTSNPSSAGTWDQAFTFSVEALSPGGNILKYNWTSTDGTLSSTTGKVTSWTPPKKSGVFTVQVSVIDTVTGGQAVGASNLTIDGSGSVTVAK